VTSGFDYQAGPVHLLRVPTGADLLGHLERYVQERDISAAWLSYLGAVRSASLRYYDQEAKEYRDFTIDQHLEVLAGAGNVSLLDGKPFIHTHAAFADAEGRAFGGHINHGCEVWALEVKLETFIGEAPIREFDERTGLSLWSAFS
jgi:predicted DNA-binding protein with PD1-like motif